MRRRHKIFAAVFAFLGLGAGVAAAQGWRHHRDPAAMEKHVDRKLERALDWLDATDVQRAAVAKVKDRLVPQFQALRSQRGDLRAFALSQLTSDKPDAAAIHAEIDARFEAMRALALETADGLIEVHGILTPEQRDRIAEKVDKFGKYGGDK